MPINISKNHMDKLKKKRTYKEEKIYKKHLVWLIRLVINYIPESIKNTVDGVKGQIMSFLQLSITVKQTCQNYARRWKNTKQFKNTKTIWTKHN